MAPDPLLPSAFRVLATRRETRDTFTMTLSPPDGVRYAFRPGQFNMLHAPGLGEAPISVSSDPAEPGRLAHTARRAGPVTAALGKLRPGDEVGVRGPFGSPWPAGEARGLDVVLMAGGIGLAPLRPALYSILRERGSYGRVSLLYGTRTPADIVFRSELRRWSARKDLRVAVTVDRADPRWTGPVGVVTTLLKGAGIDPGRTVAMICGPEIMMRFCAAELTGMGVPAGRVHVSMERNMHCGYGACGHCQLGPVFVCRDGPVFPFERVGELARVRDL